eukprot:scaffold229164_cov27-Tisochrysis_lutea.AAC.4
MVGIACVDVELKNAKMSVSSAPERRSWYENGFKKFGRSCTTAGESKGRAAHAWVSLSGKSIGTPSAVTKPRLPTDAAKAALGVKGSNGPGSDRRVETPSSKRAKSTSQIGQQKEQQVVSISRREVRARFTNRPLYKLALAAMRKETLAVPFGEEPPASAASKRSDASDSAAALAKRPRASCMRRPDLAREERRAILQLGQMRVGAPRGLAQEAAALGHLWTPRRLPHQGHSAR